MSDIAHLLVDDALGESAASDAAMESELHRALLSDRWCSLRRPLTPPASPSSSPAAAAADLAGPKAFLLGSAGGPVQLQWDPSATAKSASRAAVGAPGTLPMRSPPPNPTHFHSLALPVLLSNTRYDSNSVCFLTM